MPASYPGAIKSFTPKTDLVDDVMAVDVNELQLEIAALEEELGISPKTITDGTAPANNPASVAAYLDMIANFMKVINGGANWYAAPQAMLPKVLHDRLFGAGKPDHSYIFSRRQFRASDYPNHVAGFNVTANPFTFQAPAGGFSTILPVGSNYLIQSASSWLTLTNWDANPMGIQWTDATGKPIIDATFGLTPIPTASDYVVAELRFWDVQNPTAASKYWAVRFNWLPVSKPQYPMRVALYYGTGLTYSTTDGTIVGADAPIEPGSIYIARLTSAAGGTCYLDLSSAEGVRGLAISNVVAGWPSIIKTARFLLPSGQWQTVSLDEIYAF